MPAKGFRCPKTQEEHPFIYCLRDCPSRCHPRPVLAALINDRPHEPGVYHVTEILNPPQVVYLYRHQDYYTEPESNAYAALGTAYHLMMETGENRLAGYALPRDNAILEQSFRAEIKTPYGTAILTGRADRYEPDTKTLIDYKTEKLYSVKKYFAGNWEGSKHAFQQNIYRTFMFPEAERILLSCFIKDHGYQALARDGIPAIVNVEVPIMDSDYVREFVQAKITMLLMNEKDPSTIPDCEQEELWGGRRCEEYCAVNKYCPQYQRKGERGHVNQKRKLPQDRSFL